MEPTEKKHKTTDVLPNQHHLFDLPDDVVYLSCSGRSPMLLSTCSVGQQAVSLKLRPWNIKDDHVEEEVRALFGRLINCSSDDITFQASTSSALSLVAAQLAPYLQPGDQILIVQDQMSSNVYPWQHLVATRGCSLLIVPFPCADLTESLLNADWSRVKVCAIAPCHWSDGSLVDLVAIGARCREKGATFVVDATQAAGALSLDVAVMQPDFLCASVHKWLFGPYGICLMYCNPEWHKVLKCVDHHEHNRQGANGDDCIAFEPGKGYPETFKAGARCVDVGGRPNPILFPMLKDALTQVLRWDVKRLEDTLAPLSAAIVLRGTELGFTAPLSYGAHLVGLRCGPKLQARGVTIDELNSFLGTRRIHASSRFGALRLGVHSYNNMDDVEKLFAAITDYLATKLEQ